MENGPKLASRILEKLTDIQVRAFIFKMLFISFKA